MDNFGFIEYRHLSCKLATYRTYAKQKNTPMPAGAHVSINNFCSILPIQYPQLSKATIMSVILKTGSKDYRFLNPESRY